MYLRQFLWWQVEMFIQLQKWHINNFRNRKTSPDLGIDVRSILLTDMTDQEVYGAVNENNINRRYEQPPLNKCGPQPNAISMYTKCGRYLSLVTYASSRVAASQMLPGPHSARTGKKAFLPIFHFMSVQIHCAWQVDWQIRHQRAGRTALWGRTINSIIIRKVSVTNRIWRKTIT